MKRSFPRSDLWSLEQLVQVWPAAVPLLCLCGSGRYQIIALSFAEVDWAEVSARPLRPSASAIRSELPFQCGYIGLMPYDPAAWHRASAAPPRVFRVEQALLVDRLTGTTHVTGQVAGAAGYYRIDPAALSDRLTALRGQAGTALAPPRADEAPDGGLKLLAASSDEAYERLVEQVLDDIRGGRYYQLNLLRYFQVAGGVGESWAARRLAVHGGPYGAFMRLPGLNLYSFSPERFVGAAPRADATELFTFPIKGTAPRYLTDQRRDEQSARHLAASVKDQAELHMIVDLMRNDLQQLSRPGSVQVLNPGRLLTVSHVHHLQAEVRSTARAGLTVGGLLAALCPGGSITGAPKKEVMTAIASYEGRSRGYFMGHAFYACDSGHFDSSILIRTLVQQGHGPWEFAAGSGLVIGSAARSERDEIEAKCRVVT